MAERSTPIFFATAEMLPDSDTRDAATNSGSSIGLRPPFLGGSLVEAGASSDLPILTLSRPCREPAQLSHP